MRASAFTTVTCVHKKHTISSQSHMPRDGASYMMIRTASEHTGWLFFLMMLLRLCRPAVFAARDTILRRSQQTATVQQAV